MGVLSGNLKAASELAMTRGQDPQQPLFQTLPTAKFGELATNILAQTVAISHYY